MNGILQKPGRVVWGIMLLSLFFCATNTFGSDWQRLYPHYPPQDYNDIYAADRNNVFAVGDYGLISYYNGSSWTEMDSPAAVHLNSIWGRSANDIFAVGMNGTVLHYNGTSWQKMNTPLEHAIGNDLYGVWGFAQSGSPVYACGRNGHIIIYSNGSWSLMDTPISDPMWGDATIYAIWGSSSDRLFAVGWGYDGSTGGQGLFDIYLQYNGSSWVEDNTFPGSEPLQPESVQGFPTGDVYIGGSRGVYRLDTNGWNQILSGDFSYDGHAVSYNVWGTSGTDIWFTGDDSLSTYRLVHYNGSMDNVLATTSLKHLGPPVAITGTTTGDLFIAGPRGMIVHAIDGIVSSMTALPSAVINDVTGISEDALYGAGQGGTILSFDGRHWAPMQSPTNEDLYAVCGSPSSMFAAGDRGTVLHYDGSNWTIIHQDDNISLCLYDLVCLDGGLTAYAVGSEGTILNCGISSCSAEITDTTKNLYAIYYSEINAFAAGEDGIFLQKGPTSWDTITDAQGNPTNDIFDLWGNAQNNFLVAVGEESLTGTSYIHTYDVDNNTWTQELEDNPIPGLHSIYGQVYADLYVAGGDYRGGIVLHRNETNDGFDTLKEFSEELLSLWGIPGEIFVSTTSDIYRFTGSQWLGTYTEKGSFTDIGGSSGNNLFVVDDTGHVFHYDGDVWTSMQSGASSLNSIYVDGLGHWAVASSNDTIYRYNGSAWTSVATENAITDLWGSGDLVLAAAEGAILRSDNRGTSWASEAIPDSTANLNAIWGAGISGPFFAGGRSWDGSRYHTVLLQKAGNGNWTAMQPAGIDYIPIKAIWGSSGTSVYALGNTYPVLGENESEILHYDGTAWHSELYSYNVDPALTFSALIGTSKDIVLAFGSQELVDRGAQNYRRDKCRQTWQQLDIPSVPAFKAVWGQEGTDGFFYLYGISENAVYKYLFPIDQKCSSPWSLFLPAILSGSRR